MLKFQSIIRETKLLKHPVHNHEAGRSQKEPEGMATHQLVTSDALRRARPFILWAGCMSWPLALARCVCVLSVVTIAANGTWLLEQKM